MGLKLETQIKNTRLTKTEQLVANYFLEHMESLYFMTAKDIALALGISDTSVIRLCRTLGYHGFRDIQQQLQQELSQILEQGKYVIPYAQVPEKTEKSRDFGLVHHLDQAIKNLQNTYLKNEPSKLQKAVDIFLKSDHIFIGGFRGSAAAACYLGVLLSQYIGHVEYAVQADSSCVESVLDYGKNDCIVLIGTERYSKMACILADMARTNHCQLVAIVDKFTAPLAYHADVVLTGDTDSLTPMNSYLGMFFLIEAISIELSRCRGVYTQERLEQLNHYLTKLELY